MYNTVFLCSTVPRKIRCSLSNRALANQNIENGTMKLKTESGRSSFLPRISLRVKLENLELTADIFLTPHP